MKTDFRDFAGKIAESNGLGLMVPAIEKEIIHHEIIQSLDRHGLLDSLSFQGGTCLRLCYGSSRYSEDLDFTAGESFDSLDLDAFGEALGKDLMAAYDVEVRVRKPSFVKDFDGVDMRRWTVKVDTAPERPDLPSQRIKLEIASVPSHTSSMRQVAANYPGLPRSYSETLVKCQSLEEILADKLISFSATRKYIRHRDLWDIPWICSTPFFDFGEVSPLVFAKHADYKCPDPLAMMLAEGKVRASAVVESPEFEAQMMRFLPADVFDRTVGNEGYRGLMLSRVVEAYDLVAEQLGLKPEVDRHAVDTARSIAGMISAQRRDAEDVHKVI